MKIKSDRHREVHVTVGDEVHVVRFDAAGQAEVPDPVGRLLLSIRTDPTEYAEVVEPVQPAPDEAEAESQAGVTAEPSDHEPAPAAQRARLGRGRRGR